MNKKSCFLLQIYPNPFSSPADLLLLGGTCPYLKAGHIRPITLLPSGGGGEIKRYKEA